MNYFIGNKLYKLIIVLIKLHIKNIFNLNLIPVLRFTKLIFLFLILTIFSVYQCACNFVTHKTVSSDATYDSLGGDPEPDYNTSLDFEYQDFVSYLYIGNRVENFTGYFNTFFKANEDYNDAFDEYRASLISYYNRRLDSLGVTIPVSGGAKEKLDKAIERASKIIQFHKNSKFIDESVLIIGKSYYLLAEYYKAERTFNEFLSKFASSILADEAYLYLGRTKVKLGKMEEGEIIFKNLVSNSPDKEIQSLAARDLGVLEFNKGKPDEAVKYFKESIDYSNDNERKAESQFILAKILSYYKPELAAQEYKKVLDYTSDFDLSFYARLNYSKGLIYNKKFMETDEELESLRKKYRDESSYTQLADLEIANNLFAQQNYTGALEKYYEVIVKYPNTPSSADAYYFIGKYEEDINKDYLDALVNYKKATEENSASDNNKESTEKVATLNRYFALQGEVTGSTMIDIPTVNADVERFRAYYNEDKGILQPPTEGNKDGTNQNGEEGTPKDGIPKDGNPKGGDGKGKPGGFKNNYFRILRDSIEQLPNPVDNKEMPEVNQEELKVNQEEPKVNQEEPKVTEGENPQIENKNENINKDKDDLPQANEDSIKAVSDSMKAITDSIDAKTKEDKIFNAYYELAEIFIYSLDQTDSAENYLNLLLDKFTESDKRSKVLYTLGNFYKNNDKKTQADETFEKLISMYPNTIYANEARKILGIKVQEDGFTVNPVDKIFNDALTLFNDNNYPESISKLKEVELRFPNDTLVAKSLYSIGWIYENKLVNKDSSLFYFKKLKEKFPSSEYTLKIDPMLEYIASVETPDSTKAGKENSNAKDSTVKKVEGENQQEEVTTEKSEEKTNEVKPDTSGVNKENRLSQEEIDRLLKESEESGK